MRRLLRISIDMFLATLAHLLGWFLVGLLIDKELINMTLLTYPLWFIICAINCICGTGANISSIRDKNKDSVFSGFILGSITGLILLIAILLRVDDYILFMNMNPSTYRIFAIYAIIILYLRLILKMILSKLYYSNDTKRANRYSFLFCLISVSTLVFMSLFTKDQMIIILTSLIPTIVFIVIASLRVIPKGHFKIHLGKCIKYDSVYLFGELSMFIVYLFGLKNSFNFGEQFILANSFVSTITETQLDMIGATKTAAQVDITKNEFSYKEHIKNSNKLSAILVFTSIIMGMILYPLYKVTIVFTLVLLAIKLFHLVLYPIYSSKITFIQLEQNAVEPTIAKQIANVFRIASSFIPTPYCVGIGIVITTIYHLVYTHISVKVHKLNLEMKKTQT